MNKKILLLIVLISISVSQAFPVSYRGFFEVSVGLYKYKYQYLIDRYNYASKSQTAAILSFSTTHGIQITPDLFVGAGFGLTNKINDRMYRNHSGDYLDDGTNISYLYGDIRWDCFSKLKNGRKVSPFVDLKIGYQHFGEYFNDFFDSPGGMIIKPTIGFRIRLFHNVGANVGLYYDLVNFLKGPSDYHEPETRTYNAHPFGITLGVDF